MSEERQPRRRAFNLDPASLPPEAELEALRGKAWRALSGFEPVECLVEYLRYGIADYEFQTKLAQALDPKSRATVCLFERRDRESGGAKQRQRLTAVARDEKIAAFVHEKMYSGELQKNAVADAVTEFGVGKSAVTKALQYSPQRFRSHMVAALEKGKIVEFFFDFLNRIAPGLPQKSELRTGDFDVSVKQMPNGVIMIMGSPKTKSEITKAKNPRKKQA